MSAQAIRKPVKRFSVYIKYDKSCDFMGAYFSHNGRLEWSYRTAKKHLKDCVKKQLSGDAAWSDVWHVSIVEA